MKELMFIVMSAVLWILVAMVFNYFGKKIFKD
jgi:hypothetical protein